MGPASRNIKFLIIIFVEHRKSLTNFVLHCIFIYYLHNIKNKHACRYLDKCKVVNYNVYQIKTLYQVLEISIKIVKD